MASVILIFVVVWAALLVVLWAGTNWLQSALYTEPAGKLGWRALATATVLVAFMAFWALLSNRAPGRYAPVFLFSFTEVKEFPELRAVIRRDGKETQERYRLRKDARGRSEYLTVTPPYKPLPSRPESIIVEEDGAPVRFDLEGGPRRGTTRDYRDDRGRVMSEQTLGKLYTNYWGRFVVNVLFNLVYLAIWFSCLWLILHFTWPHALGFAVAFWVVMVLVIVPMVLNRVEETTRSQPAPTAQSARPILTGHRMCMMSPSCTMYVFPSSR